jgi:uncharacterized protein (DUF488 family)
VHRLVRQSVATISGLPLSSKRLASQKQIFSSPGEDYDRCMTKCPSEAGCTLFTIGHSTRRIDLFLRLLRSHDIKQVIDIRTIPKSRRNPQFNDTALAASLEAGGMVYVHLKDLGGLRRAKTGSMNLGWRNAGFRGYADYMQTPQFTAALDRAIDLAKKTPTVLMCAEAVPWRCHRSLVADALFVRGIPVQEIIDSAKPREHKLTPFARVRGTQITYPGDQPTLPGLG